jgi:hypothetical protein
VRTRDPNLATHSFDDFLAITAKEWSDRVRRGREAGRRLGDRYFELRYEDLVASPELWAQRVLDVLGAASDPDTVRACVEAASFEKLSRGRKPGQEDASSFFRKGLPDAWREDLSTAQSRRFVELSGPLLEELGYHP